MSALNEDVFLLIGNLLMTRDKLHLAMSSSANYHLRFKFTYHEEFNITKIAKLPYVNNFKNIEAPKSILESIKQDKCIYFKASTSAIPDGTTHLEFDDNFNAPIKSIPSSVVWLAFGKRFNPKIFRIPSSVKYLIFGDDFDKPIRDLIPESVVFLIFGNSFNRSIKYAIRDSVKYLQFGDQFNQPIDDLASPLACLILGSKFCQMDAILPQSVEYLVLGDCNHKQLSKLPSSITHLIFGNSFNLPIIEKHCKFVHIVIESYIPPKVTHLTFGDRFNKSTERAFPLTLTHLKLGRDFDQEIYNVPSVQLTLSRNYLRNRPLMYLRNRPLMYLCDTKIVWY